MARLARVAPIGVPVHVYQRGNNHIRWCLEKRRILLRIWVG
jgi:hypothetical protein